MRNLLINDLRLILAGLLAGHASDIGLLLTGPLHLAALQRQHARFEALLGPDTSDAPLATELGALDARHDAIGEAIWDMTSAYLKHPDTTDEQRAAAQELQAAFIPSLMDLRASYADEAAHAQARRNLLPTLAAKLDLFPLAGGQTLRLWVEQQLEAGEGLGDLLEQRADTLHASPDLRDLRHETLKALQALRASVAQERALRPELPSDLDARLFGFSDERVAQRRLSLQRRQGRTDPTAPTDPSEPA